jgi:hypothetical protein
MKGRAVCAHDATPMLFGSAYLTVRDEECSFFVEAKSYVVECKYVTGARDGFFSVSDNPCPNLKRVIISYWRAAA